MLPRVVYYTYMSKKNNLLRNIGDRVIFLGVKNIMRIAIGPHEIVECDFDGDEVPGPETDIIVFCGTPQISCITAPLPIHRKMILALASGKPVLNIGAGSFHFNSETQSDFIASMQTGFSKKFFQFYNQFSVVTTRDPAAQTLLETVGVNAILLPCPGFYSTLNHRKQKKSRKYISPLGPNSTFWDVFENNIFEYFSEISRLAPDFLFLAHDHSDIELLESIGCDYIRCEREEDFIQTLAECAELISFRVHSALPARTFGARVVLAGFDNRIYMAKHFGFAIEPIDLLQNQSPKSIVERLANLGDQPGEQIILERGLKDYVDTIKSALGPHLESISRRLAYPTMMAGYFFSLEPIVDVPLRMLMTHREVVDQTSDCFTVLRDDREALFFGPYIRLQRGKFRLRLDIANDMHDSIIVIVRDTAGRLLARKALETLIPGEQLHLDFDHSRDTPRLEVQIFPGSEAVSRAYCITSMQFERLV